jgi:hypothetical protein
LLFAAMNHCEGDVALTAEKVGFQRLAACGALPKQAGALLAGATHSATENMAVRNTATYFMSSLPLQHPSRQSA